MTQQFSCFRDSRFRNHCAIAAVLCLISSMAAAQNAMYIDASSPTPQPAPLLTTLGSSRAPDGRTIGANSQYLTLNGKPWIPVMGEFHYSRYPAEQWEQEILKMKASGVQVIATYIIWLHHEQNEGEWNWKGQRDLHQFAELCRKHGMYLYPRIGPWAHAEARNGGLPDWVIKKSPVRRNDPVYLAEVQQLYTQIAAQLKGELWKDGGPVIGIQLENEYRDTGAGAGAEHIRTLKQMAVKDGFDVPFYTVTGWDGAAIPLDAVLPVFGGYPDAPWGGDATKLTPNEVYAFRFDNRSAGSMGAIGGGGQSAASTYEGTPFLTAEVGDGIQDTYFRRPVVSADDIAAIPTVMLGSGANMLGYYMFHGGRNPDGGAITLQESQRTGYPTDVPVKSYDFQAPLGEFGQQRDSLRKLKLVHYFLNDFGDLLAPMSPHRPSKVPSAPDDLSIPRVSARTAGDTGFVFFNNYVRGATMPARNGFQVALKLPSGMTHIPDNPIDLPSGAYGIWPLNLALPGATLRYSTAQLFKRVVSHGETYFFFAVIPGVAPQFALDEQAVVESAAGMQQGKGKVFTADEGTSREVVLAGGVHLVLLPREKAEQVWRVDDPSLLLATTADVFSEGNTWTLESMGDPNISFGVFGSDSAPTAGSVTVTSGARKALFREYRASLSPLEVQAKVSPVHMAAARSPWQYGAALSWRPKPVPLAPDDADFNTAAEWKITLPSIQAKPQVADVFLSIAYNGDAARLYQNGKLVDDSFWNGLPWEIGLREVHGNLDSQPSQFGLQILPLPKSYPMYIEQSPKLKFANDASVSSAPQVRLVPEYHLVLHAPESR